MKNKKSNKKGLIKKRGGSAVTRGGGFQALSNDVGSQGLGDVSGAVDGFSSSIRGGGH